MEQILIKIVLILTLLLAPASTTTTYVEVPVEPSPAPEEVEEIEIVELYPELVPICTCESGQGTGEPQHYDINTGEVLRGEINSRDTGMCQINLTYHQEAAERMGLDVNLEEDNIRYANWLYEQQGTRPWSWSASCWNK